jgi:two-component system nitrate/nitrite response regulator NarL
MHFDRRVVIVDDNPNVLQDLRLFFEISGGLEIIGEATNGQEAIRLVQQLKPDVVVMDLEMPVMNGYDATKQIKKNYVVPRVVILSVHTEPEVQEKVRLAGADEFVIKGASYDVLLKAILGE